MKPFVLDYVQLHSYMVEGNEKRIRELMQRVRGVDLRTDYYHRVAYAFDATGKKVLCGAVAFPRCLEDLSSLIRSAALLGISITPRGAGTGFSGGSVPSDGGLVISTEKMRRILSFDPAAGEIEVEAGIVNAELQEYLEPKGLFYPPDPASFRVSTIGGNIAENAGGPRAYKYGVTRRYVRSISWVTAEGETIESSSGGIGALLTGAEGTLGMIYSSRLTVLPIPRYKKTFLLKSGNGESAMNLASNLLHSGFRPSVLEFIDSKTMKCVGEYLGIPSLISNPSGGDYLFLEVEGNGAETSAQARILEDFCRRRGLALKAAVGEDERELLWQLRRSISPSLARRGITKVNEDISLPLGKLSKAVEKVHAMALRKRLDCYLFGHCGDGNLHVNIMTDRRRAGEMKRVGEFVEELFDYVTEAEGALSGEHGIGLTKRPYLHRAFSPFELTLQSNIKGILDSAGVLNPGKYFDSASGG